MKAFTAAAASALVTTVAAHGSMITPPPRQAHGQKYDASNKCDCHETGHCYSNITGDAHYCGVGCLGEACLYYQIGCFQGCGVCSMSGKDLYPTAEDLQLAGNCKPPEPTLPEEFRSYNRDSLSSAGDWTRVNPWRSPGTAGLGNTRFQPCGVNSGWRHDPPARGSAGPAAGGQPLGANGTDLPPVGNPTVWKSGSVQEVEFSIYANHGGGYAYRLCKMNDQNEPTEACFQQGHLKFASDTTKIVYHDGLRQPFNISARTVSTGTHPAGSQWRLNPIPMCNCDQGAYCSKKNEVYDGSVDVTHRLLQGKCETELETVCGSAKKEGEKQCDECLKTNWKQISADGCSKPGFKFCSGKAPTPSPSPAPVGNQFTPYEKTYFRPGQVSKACPTGLMFNASWDEGVGSGPNPTGYGDMPYSMVDTVQVPSTLGRYMLSWRWDCEQTPQVWNSCADIVIV